VTKFPVRRFKARPGRAGMWGVNCPKGTSCKGRDARRGGGEKVLGWETRHPKETMKPIIIPGRHEASSVRKVQKKGNQLWWESNREFFTGRESSDGRNRKERGRVTKEKVKKETIKNFITS